MWPMIWLKNETKTEWDMLLYLQANLAIEVLRNIEIWKLIIVL